MGSIADLRPHSDPGPLSIGMYSGEGKSWIKANATSRASSMPAAGPGNPENIVPHLSCRAMLWFARLSAIGPCQKPQWGRDQAGVGRVAGTELLSREAEPIPREFWRR